MIPISKRYGLPLLALLVAVALPVGFLNLAPRRIDDCIDPGAFFDLERIDERFTSTLEKPEGEASRPNHARARIEPPTPRSAELQIVARLDYGLSGRYQHPASTILSRLEPDRSELRWVESGGDRIPIHLDYQQIDAGVRFAAYFFAHAGKPVVGPFRTRIRSAPRELLRGTRPILMVVVSGTSGLLTLHDTERRATEALATVWSHYQEMCTNVDGSARTR